MVKVILIQKNSDLKEYNIKNFNEDDLYKKAGFRNDKNFGFRTSWESSDGTKDILIKLYAKDEGRAGTENKYDMPPPVDTKLYFGICILVAYDSDNNLTDLTNEVWKKTYEKLFGGFHDIDNEESYSEDELDDVPAKYKTKDGYLKDNFIVDSDSDTNDSTDVSSETSDNIGVDTFSHVLDEEDLDNCITKKTCNKEEKIFNVGGELEIEVYIYSSDEE